jgi:MFS superfamily sulfate permease-like transporter
LATHERTERIMAEDRHGQGLHDTQAERSTSPAAKTIGYAVIAILLLAIILLATGVVKFGPWGGLV